MGHEELVRRAMDAFNRGDMEALREITAPGLKIVPFRAALENIEYTGPNALDEFWADATSAWSELRVDIDEVETAGERAVAHGVLRGTARESGAKVESQPTWTFTFRDGLIEEIHTRVAE